MIVFIPQIVTAGNRPVPEAELFEWLPRLCPRCRVVAVIGHGRRRKPAHDENHTFLRVRRGRCQHCRLTITVLPAWSLPHTHYTLNARADALRRLVELNVPLEQAAPSTQDPHRVADPGTIRHWLRRRAVSWWARLRTLQRSGCRTANLLAPTILSWDWPAVDRILFPEPEPP